MLFYKESPEIIQESINSSLTAAFVGILVAIFIRRTIVIGKAFHLEAPRGIADVTRLTLTGSSVIQHRANGVRSAINQRARIGAVMLDASLRIRAISVDGALVRYHTAGSHRITGSAYWTDAAIGSLKIDALRARVTRLIIALVHV